MTAFTPTVALITGASSGFGAAVAERFAARGVRVVLAARRLDKLRVLEDGLVTKPFRWNSPCATVTTTDSLVASSVKRSLISVAGSLMWSAPRDLRRSL